MNNWEKISGENRVLDRLSLNGFAKMLNAGDTCALCPLNNEYGDYECGCCTARIIAWGTEHAEPEPEPEAIGYIRIHIRRIVERGRAKIEVVKIEVTKEVMSGYTPAAYEQYAKRVKAIQDDNGDWGIKFYDADGFPPQMLSLSGATRLRRGMSLSPGDFSRVDARIKLAMECLDSAIQDANELTATWHGEEIISYGGIKDE